MSVISDSDLNAGDVLYFQKKSVDKDKIPKVNKIDIALMVILWVLSVWSIIADRISDPELEMVSSTARFWIGLTVPICATTSALIESIQVGIDKYKENEFKKGLLQMTTKIPKKVTTNNINISSSNPNNIQTIASLKQLASSTRTISFNDENNVKVPKTESRTNFLLNNSLSDDISVSSDKTDEGELAEFNKHCLESNL